ncbi:MAG: phosphatidic acid phosphatase [Clostridia bacterium]|nr:phosphatidic acid phosphatase [Clostridia bacterium]MBR0444056.1 phosphatidic acid phosphatase [Clostridia bacterium]
MKKQLVDYRGFSLRKLNDPRFSHIKLLWGWIAYFAMYFLTENLIPADRCHPIHCALDDVIPFNEYFVIFYVGWFFLVAGSLAFTLFYDVPRFKKLQIFIMITQAVAMLCYIIYPSRQDLRPEVFPRENVMTAVIRFLYAFDTNTGVCPSLHVAYSLGILSVSLKDDMLPWWAKTVLTVIILLICMAVCFIKQHSAVDVFAAAIVALFAELIVYGKDYWLPKIRKQA